MALVVAELESLRDELIRARLNPYERMSDGAKQIVQKSGGEIVQAIAWVEAEIARVKGESQKPRRRHYVTRTGW